MTDAVDSGKSGTAALDPALDPAIARRTWRSLEPLHAMIYFVPEAHERYAALGLDQRSGYFASRGAVFGPVGPEIVVATFFNFCPELVAGALPAAWQHTGPAAVLDARLAAADAALTRALGDAVHGPQVAEAATLARRAAEAATAHPQGRPLFAAHAALPWPEPAHLVLWRAQTLLREFRGDGHVAALTTAGLTGLQALVLHAASGEADGEVLRRTRGWSHEQWAGAADELRAAGLLDPGTEPTLSDAGTIMRAQIEATTDRLSTPAYAAIGPDGCARLVELGRPLTKVVLDAGLLGAAAGMIRRAQQPTR